MLFYLLLVGRLPFTGSLPEQLVDIVQSEPPRLRNLRPEIAPDLEVVCLKAMAKRPADRYPSAAELADALQRTPTGASRGGWRSGFRRRLTRIGSCAAVTLLVAVAIELYAKTGHGTLVLETSQSDLEVVIDSKISQIASAKLEIQLPVGEHELAVRKKGLEGG